MIITDWTKTYVFLGYPPSAELENEIFNKAKEVRAAWRKNNPINPNVYPYLSKISEYSYAFLQQYFADRIETN